MRGGGSTAESDYEPVSADRDGKVRRTTDGGRSWEERGSVGSGPRELISDARGELFAAVNGGEVRASRDGGASWKTVTRITGS